MLRKVLLIAIFACALAAAGCDGSEPGTNDPSSESANTSQDQNTTQSAAGNKVCRGDECGTNTQWQGGNGDNNDTDDDNANDTGDDDCPNDECSSNTTQPKTGNPSE